jgi:hypothetical protein
MRHITRRAGLIGGLVLGLTLSGGSAAARADEITEALSVGKGVIYVIGSPTYKSTVGVAKTDRLGGLVARLRAKGIQVTEIRVFDPANKGTVIETIRAADLPRVAP